MIRIKQVYILFTSFRPVCLIFKKVWLPRHFLLGIGHPMRKLQISTWAFQRNWGKWGQLYNTGTSLKGTQGNFHGHGGNLLLFLHDQFTSTVQQNQTNYAVGFWWVWDSEGYRLNWLNLKPESNLISLDILVRSLDWRLSHASIRLYQPNSKSIQYFSRPPSHGAIMAMAPCNACVIQIT